MIPSRAPAPARVAKRAPAPAAKRRKKHRRGRARRDLAPPPPVERQIPLLPDEWFHQLQRAAAGAREVMTIARYRPPRGRQLVIKETIRSGREHPKGYSMGVADLTPAEKRAKTMRHRFPILLERPRTRQECETEPRPCPWVSCSMHLYLDVVRGALHLNFPDMQPWEMPISCALDIAEMGGINLPEVGALFNVTMERGRQILEDALAKLKLYCESNPDSPFVKAIEARIRGEADAGE